MIFISLRQTLLNKQQEHRQRVVYLVTSTNFNTSGRILLRLIIIIYITHYNVLFVKQKYTTEMSSVCQTIIDFNVCKLKIAESALIPFSSSSFPNYVHTIWILKLQIAGNGILLIQQYSIIESSNIRDYFRTRKSTKVQIKCLADDRGPVFMRCSQPENQVS